MKKITLYITILSIITLVFLGFGHKPVNAQVFCYTFNTDLKVGSAGNDVDALRTILAREGFSRNSTWYYNYSNSNTFDEELASFVSGFQEKYRSDILYPLGYQHGTGYVGYQTRSKLNALYSCGTNNYSDITVTTTPTKSVFRSYEDITFSITARNNSSYEKVITFNNGCQTSYSIGSYNSTSNQFCTQIYSTVRIPAYGSYTWNMTHYQSNYRLGIGTYTLTGRVVGYTESTATITISDSGTDGGYYNTGDIRVLSPNGGQYLRSGTSQLITWQMPYVQYFAAQSVDLKLIPADNYTVYNNSNCPIGSTCPYTGNTAYYNYNTNYPYNTYNNNPYYIARGLYGTSYNWTVGNTSSYWSGIPAGTYYLEACLNNSGACDRSDSTITIY